MIQGLLQANEDVVVNRDLCAQLLAHEVTRTFHDRLICQEDREKFFVFLSEMLHDYFKVFLCMGYFKITTNSLHAVIRFFFIILNMLPIVKYLPVPHLIYSYALLLVYSMHAE